MRFKTLAFIAILLISGSAFGQITLNRDGQLDRQFGTNGVTIADPATQSSFSWGLTNFTQLPDGKILTMFDLVFLGPSDGIALFRYLENGDLDNSFGSNGKLVLLNWPQFNPQTIAVQPDGKIVIVGSTAQGSDFMIVRLTASGQPDPEFGSNGVVTKDFAVSGGISVDTAFSIAIQSDGKIIAIGASQRNALDRTGEATVSIVRMNPNGSIDKTFGNGGICIKVGDTFNSQVPDDRSLKATLLANGKLVVVTTEKRYASPTSSDFSYFDTILQFVPDGSLDPSFGTGGRLDIEDSSTLSISGFHVYPDGKMLLASFTSLIRFNPDGSIDNSLIFFNFSPNAFYGIYCLAVLPDGKILLGGSKQVGSDASAQYFSAIRRYYPDGTPDIKFGSHGESLLQLDPNTLAYRTALTPNNRLLIVGVYGQEPDKSFIARYFAARK